MDLPGLFVVGTDTGVGKTRVAAAIARALAREGRRVGALKPVASGVGEGGPGDADVLLAAIGGDPPRERVAPLEFDEPLAPAVAARRLGVPLTRGRVLAAAQGSLDWWSGRADVMIVEGAGGLLTPIAEQMTVADLAVALDYPLVIVARRGLGTLNHTLLTVEAARLRGLRVAGVILNRPEPGPETLAEATNADELARHLGAVPILAELAYADDPGAIGIAAAAPNWYPRAQRPRHPGLS